ncbi:hypothetical protein ACFL54_09925 [Planctomycetota bacterium]
MPQLISGWTAIGKEPRPVEPPDMDRYEACTRHFRDCARRRSGVSPLSLSRAIFGSEQYAQQAVARDYILWFEERGFLEQAAQRKWQFYPITEKIYV